jgi:hypothetical protein
MVDALRRARDWVSPDGLVIDVHPTATPAWLEVDGQRLGRLDGGDAPERHARASAALASAIDAKLFSVTAVVGFMAATYGDSIEELRNHIETHWRSTRIGPELVERADAVLAARPSIGRLRVVEDVTLTSLRVRRAVEVRSRPRST